jgi:hypothetical protein
MTTLAAPFPTKADYQLISGQGLSTVNFQRYDDVRLAGLPISSNSTGMVHSEQMLTLDGAIRLGKSAARGTNQIENRSKLELNGACVVRRPLPEERVAPDVKLYGKWIGQMLPGQSAAFSLQPIRLGKGQVPFKQERVDAQKLERSDKLNLEPMFRLALDPQHMEPGEVRLVARVDEVLPGETITPSASQVRGATLIVAHLEYAPLPPPAKDRNTKRDVKADTKNTDEEERFEVFE